MVESMIETIIEKSQLTLEAGIWIHQNDKAMSYPETGHDSCFELEDNSFWFSHRNNMILNMLKTYTKNENIYDIGGGNGYVSYFLQQNNFNPILIEPGHSGCRNARERGLKYIIRAVFTDLKIEDNCLENIGLFDVLEHIVNDTQFLSELHEKMTPGGKIFITVPTFRFLWSNEDVLAGHFRRYTKKSISKLLENNGFEIEYISYFFSILVFPIFFFRTIPSLFSKPKIQTDKNKSEHSSEGVFSKIVNYFLKHEQKQIASGKQKCFGSSCIIVAKKRI
jgi:SAM-dependent methyltransferase